MYIGPRRGGANGLDRHRIMSYASNVVGVQLEATQQATEAVIEASCTEREAGSIIRDNSI